MTLLVTVEMMIIFMGIEIKSALIRFYQEFESVKLTGQLMGSSILINVLGCFVVTGFSLMIFPTLLRNHDQGNSILPYLLLTCYVAAAQSLYWCMLSYHRARNEALKYLIFNLLSALFILSFSLLALMVFHAGIKGILLVQIASYGIIALFIFLNLLRTIPVAVSSFTFWQLVRFAFPVAVAASTWSSMGAVNRYFLAYFMGLEVVGIYDLGYKLASFLLLTVVMPFQMAYGPFAFANLERPDIKEKLGRLFMVLILSLLSVSLIVILALPSLMRIVAPPEYLEAYGVTLYILPSIAMTGIYYWAVALIQIVKKTYVIGLTAVLAAGLNIVLSYWLIPLFGWRGSAVATNIAVLFVTLTIFIIGMRLFPVPLRHEFMTSIKAIRGMLTQYVGKEKIRLPIKVGGFDSFKEDL